MIAQKIEGGGAQRNLNPPRNREKILTSFRDARLDKKIMFSIFENNIVKLNC